MRGRVETFGISRSTAPRLRQVTHFPDSDIFDFFWSTDGKQLAITRRRTCRTLSGSEVLIRWMLDHRSSNCMITSVLPQCIARRGNVEGRSAYAYSSLTRIRRVGAHGSITLAAASPEHIAEHA